MKIVGFGFTKILVQRKEKLGANLKITQNININEVITEKIPISKEEAIKVEFNFTVNYSEDSSEDLAKLEFEGFVIFIPEKNELKNFLKEWKEKKIPEESKIPLFNFIMGKCNVKALTLEDELGLPLHFPTPRISGAGQN